MAEFTRACSMTIRKTGMECKDGLMTDIMRESTKMESSMGRANIVINMERRLKEFGNTGKS